MPGKANTQAGRLLFAAAVLVLLHAMPETCAANEVNPCGQTSVIRDLVTNFNATPAARAQHLAMVDVVQMTTVTQMDGRLVCHGIVFDSEGAKTPMIITIAKNASGHPTWSLRLDGPVHPAAVTS